MTAPGHPRELLAAYLDDELTVEERSSVDRHLALCASCRKQLASLAALARAIAEEPVPDIPADFAARIGRGIDEAAVVRMPARRRYLVPASIAATIAAVGLLLVVQWRERAPVPERQATAPATQLPAALPELQKSTERRPEPPPAEYKQDLPVLDRAKEKDIFRAPAPAEPSPPVRERDEGRGNTGYAPVPDVVPSAPPPAPGAKGEERAASALEDRAAAAAAPRGERGRMRVDSLGYLGAASGGCAERWVDTGLLGAWSVEDEGRAARDLATLAQRLGGRVERVDPYPDQLALVIPRTRVPEMIGALRGRGVAGLEGPVNPEEGFDCVRQRVRLESAGGR